MCKKSVEILKNAGYQCVIKSGGDAHRMGLTKVQFKTTWRSVWKKNEKWVLVTIKDEFKELYPIESDPRKWASTPKTGKTLTESELNSNDNPIKKSGKKSVKKFGKTLVEVEETKEFIPGGPRSYYSFEEYQYYCKHPKEERIPSVVKSIGKGFRTIKEINKYAETLR